MYIVTPVSTIVKPLVQAEVTPLVSFCRLPGPRLLMIMHVIKDASSNTENLSFKFTNFYQVFHQYFEASKF